MKIKNGFVMNKVGQQYVVVPVGQMSVSRNCMVQLNSTGAFLWELLQSDTDGDSLALSLSKKYDIDASQAKNDVEAFLNTLRASDLLDD